MTRSQQLIILALTALNEAKEGVDGKGAVPSSFLMLLLKVELDTYQKLLEVLSKSGHITYTSELVRLTERGREIAVEINEAIKKAKAGG